MCGISGIANFNQPVNIESYYPNHLKLIHRGRDDEGFLTVQGDHVDYYRGNDTIAAFKDLPHISEVQQANVVLGYRRLAIIDLSAGGHQPLVDPSGRFSMVYNGEIYNYIELRQELEQLGHRFQTQCDAEVLLRAFVEWGTDCFNRLNGMWALAIYDQQEQTLLICRDRFGVKPLFYTFVDNTLYFASELKFLLPFLENPQVNEARAMEFVVGGLVDHHEQSLFDGISQLMPGHFAVFDQTGFHTSRYWQLPKAPLQLSFSEASQQLQEMLTSAVSLRLRSDVPVGSLLSGGLDSTAIVCIIHRLLTEQQATNSFECFSAVYKEEEYSERQYVEAVIGQTQLPIHWVFPNAEQLIEDFDALLYYQELPIRSLAVYSQWALMKKVSQTPITVLLNGQGSDEVFAGYTNYSFELIAEYLRRFRWLKAWQESEALSRVRPWTPLHILRRGIGEWKAQAWTTSASTDSIPYFNKSYQPHQWQPESEDLFRNALVKSLMFSALPEYLRYDDRNSMAFTLEGRLPFMDYRLIEWAMNLPAQFKVDRALSKRVLRHASQDFIPESVAQRRDKMGFVTPQQAWQKNELAPYLERMFQSDLQEIFPFLNLKACQTRYKDYTHGADQHWGWVWRVACLYWWHQRMLEGKEAVLKQ